MEQIHKYDVTELGVEFHLMILYAQFCHLTKLKQNLDWAIEESTIHPPTHKAIALNYMDHCITNITQFSRHRQSSSTTRYYS